jgi:hypothetical protein
MPTQLTAHFTLDEFLVSTTAAQLGIPNTPTPEALKNLERLATVMEKVRGLTGHPIQITSGYRNAAVNQAVGGVANSAHLTGLACDWICPAFGTPERLCKLVEPCMGTWQIDQLIWEYGSWVHLGLAPDGSDARQMALTIDSSGTRSGFA